MIRIGPSGFNDINQEEIFKRLNDKGLSALEVPFTYGVWMKKEQAIKLGKLAKESKISLSIHSPYYINLASKEEEKIEASIKRIIDSCKMGHELGATHIVFHPGFYMKRDQEIVYQMIKSNIIKILKIIKEKNWNIKIAPETTGKKSQFGSLNELLKLRKETGCSICIDFAHLLAREGKINYPEIFKKIKNLNHIHAHFSGIEYTEKGERKHLLLTEQEIKPLIEELIKNGFNKSNKESKLQKSITLICESPDPLGDAEKINKTQKLIQQNP